MALDEWLRQLSDEQKFLHRGELIYEQPGVEEFVKQLLNRLVKTGVLSRKTATLESVFLLMAHHAQGSDTYARQLLGKPKDDDYKGQEHVFNLTRAVDGALGGNAILREYLITSTPEKRGVFSAAAGYQTLRFIIFKRIAGNEQLKLPMSILPRRAVPHGTSLNDLGF
ncbi:hypothetical protein HYX10_03755 [Candidatus Woesearchaeota archaeon]|nr:hypothetical protein [Candidatus Woesearchaeota archaeon]